MKTILLSVFAFLIASSAVAQQMDRSILQNDIKEAPNHESVRQKKSVHTAASRSTIAQWVNFIDMTSSYYSSTPDYDYYFLFPDTTVLANYSSSYDIPFIHSFGMTYDLSSDVIKAGIGGLSDEFDISMNVSIDTIATYGRYSKGSAGYVDTLIYRVVPRGANNLNRIGYFTGQLTKYPTSSDTTRYRRLYWDSVAREPFGVIAEYKVPLVLSDTIANGLIYPKAVTSGLSVPSIFAITIDFKPGGSYLAGDTMGQRIGAYTQVVAEHNGNETYHNYEPGDFTGSSSVHRTVRYNYSSTGWNGRYIPYLAYGASQFEAIDIDLFLRQNNTYGIDEYSQNVSLFQNFPNPASGSTTIKYLLRKESNVSFSLMDVTGKIVFTESKSRKNEGMNSIEIDTKELNSGIYFYSIIVDGNKFSRKMIVTK